MTDIVKKESLVKGCTGSRLDNLSLKNKGRRFNKGGKSRWDSLIIIADTSGSMDGAIDRNKTKMEAEKEALVNMVEMGLEGSQTTIIQCPGNSYDYDYDEPKVYPTTSRVVDLSLQIKKLHVTGGTPLLKSLQVAYQIAEEGRTRFILMSDGMPTDCEPDEILDLVKGRDIVIDVVAIGNPAYGNYDPEFLKKIAELTGGIYKEVHDHMSFVEELYKLSPAERKQITDGKSDRPIAL